jgi:hypothetical protein
MTTRLRMLATAVMITLLCVGCSNAPTSNASTSTPRDKAVKFSECMRDHGVAAFPDPDASGQLTIDGVANGTSVNPDSAAFKKAIAACKDLQPSGFMGHKRSGSQQSAALKFAECMRKNGVKDFPDPAAGEPLVNTNRIPSSGTEAGMTILNAAMRTCGAIWGDKLGVTR